MSLVLFFQFFGELSSYDIVSAQRLDHMKEKSFVRQRQYEKVKEAEVGRDIT